MFVRLCFIIHRDEGKVSQKEMRNFVKKVNQFITFNESKIQSATVSGLTKGWFTVIFNSETRQNEISDLVNILKNETPEGFLTNGCIVDEIEFIENNCNVSKTKAISNFTSCYYMPSDI
ncbi:hypothetical protein MIS33_10855 [Wielerella bovis]|uniref:hypothetical protein n=1 Tax=Wielerella bovis TaxID=2917790 RepID=UPI002018CACA|nr:hypothetical protein [Wielerella bovis]ULJ64611.1 hypothetical protein MIS33_10855 [Wielerella bovis]